MLICQNAFSFSGCWTLSGRLVVMHSLALQSRRLRVKG